MKVTFPLLLFTVFLVLKLTSVIAWSWWWVTAPLWGGFAAIALIGLATFFIVALSEARKQSRR